MARCKAGSVLLMPNVFYSSAGVSEVPPSQKKFYPPNPFRKLPATKRNSDTDIIDLTSDDEIDKSNHADLTNQLDTNVKNIQHLSPYDQMKYIILEQIIFEIKLNRKKHDEVTQRTSERSNSVDPATSDKGNGSAYWELDPTNHLISSNLSILLCKECNRRLNRNHLTRVPHECSKCKFSSNCFNNYSKHLLYHSVGETDKSIQRQTSSSPRMSKSWHCSCCLFSTADGDELARHLVIECPPAFGKLRDDDDPSQETNSKKSTRGSRKRRRLNSISSD